MKILLMLTSKTIFLKIFKMWNNWQI